MEEGVGENKLNECCRALAFQGKAPQYERMSERVSNKGKNSYIQWRFGHRRVLWLDRWMWSVKEYKGSQKRSWWNYSCIT